MVTSKMERVPLASSNIGYVVVAWADNISHLGLQIAFRIILCVAHFRSAICKVANIVTMLACAGGNAALARLKH